MNMKYISIPNWLLYVIHFTVIVWVQWITQAMMSPYRVAVSVWLIVVFMNMVLDTKKKSFYALYVILLNYTFLYLTNYFINTGKLPSMNWEDLYFITGPFYTGLSFVFGNNWQMLLGRCY